MCADGAVLNESVTVALGQPALAPSASLAAFEEFSLKYAEALQLLGSCVVLCQAAHGGASGWRVLLYPPSAQWDRDSRTGAPGACISPRGSPTLCSPAFVPLGLAQVACWCAGRAAGSPAAIWLRGPSDSLLRPVRAHFERVSLAQRLCCELRAAAPEADAGDFSRRLAEEVKARAAEDLPEDLLTAWLATGWCPCEDRGGPAGHEVYHARAAAREDLAFLLRSQVAARRGRAGGDADEGWMERSAADSAKALRSRHTCGRWRRSLLVDVCCALTSLLAAGERELGGCIAACVRAWGWPCTAVYETGDETAARSLAHLLASRDSVGQARERAAAAPPPLPRGPHEDGACRRSLHGWLRTCTRSASWQRTGPLACTARRVTCVRRMRPCGRQCRRATRCCPPLHTLSICGPCSLRRRLRMQALPRLRCAWPAGWRATGRLLVRSCDWQQPTAPSRCQPQRGSCVPWPWRRSARRTARRQCASSAAGRRGC